MTNQELIKIAEQAQQNAYAPYSKYKVGCAILCKNGEVITGCNVENVAGTSNCAERTAIFAAIAKGNNQFEKIAIIGDGTDYCYPCGACRQVIIEHSPNAKIICAKNANEYEEHLITELLPYAFSPNSLKKLKYD